MIWNSPPLLRPPPARVPRTTFITISDETRNSHNLLLTSQISHLSPHFTTQSRFFTEKPFDVFYSSLSSLHPNSLFPHPHQPPIRTPQTNLPKEKMYSGYIAFEHRASRLPPPRKKFSSEERRDVYAPRGWGAKMGKGGVGVVYVWCIDVVSCRSLGSCSCSCSLFVPVMYVRSEASMPPLRSFNLSTNSPPLRPDPPANAIGKKIVDCFTSTASPLPPYPRFS